MPFAPIVAAPLTRGADGVPLSTRYGDVYHPAAGPAGQARHVFLGGNGLPGRWQGRERFVILECGFGLGNNFLATWQAWRDDAQRPDRLHFISIDRHPLSREDMARAHAASPWPDLQAELITAWPPLTPDLHRLGFDDGKVELLLALGDVQTWLPQLRAQVDAFYLDGFAPAGNPEMWQPRVFKALARLAGAGATLATWSVARGVRDGLRSAGFAVERAAGIDGKREISRARFAPAFAPRRTPAAQPAGPAAAARHAVIVGAGLAGCATAWALAQQGWTSTLLDRHAAPAQEASGNVAGAFHGIVNPQDGAHARFNRSAAMHVYPAIARALQSGAVAGTCDGLLRLEQERDVAGMRHLAATLGLPADFVRALDAAQASELSGVKLDHPAWFYARGGCVDPAALARHFVEQCGGACEFRGNVAVDSIEHDGGAWHVLDAAGQSLCHSGPLILANSGDAARLLGGIDWPLTMLRGQVSVLPASARAPSAGWPRLPIAGDGVVLPEVQGQILFGATSSRDDLDPAARASDHAANLDRLARLCPQLALPAAEVLRGRVAWRCSSIDKLPLIGAVPNPRTALHSRRDHVRLLERVPGLHVFIGLGSRGITWSVLGARLLGAMIAGGPAPLPGSLADAVDPGRFSVRQARREHAKGEP
jgi:tRNA 5-methylaminomethyl-2-thiouridine biosynthesis bifunctional protein